MKKKLLATIAIVATISSYLPAMVNIVEATNSQINQIEENQVKTEESNTTKNSANSITENTTKNSEENVVNIENTILENDDQIQQEIKDTIEINQSNTEKNMENLQNSVIIQIADKKIKDYLISKNYDTNNDNEFSTTEMENVKTIDITNGEVSSLQGLEYATNLLWLSIQNKSSKDNGYCRTTKIADLTPIQNLKNLKNLTLSNCGITDISAIKNLQNLQNLRLYNNYITDISAIKDFSNLYNLNIVNISKKEYYNEKNSKIEDISILKSLTILEMLQLENAELSSISDLTGLTKLNYLNLNNNNIEDISVISNFTNLKDLDLSNNKIEDMSVFNKMQEMSSVKIQNQTIVKELEDVDMDKVSGFPVELPKNFKQAITEGNKVYLSGNEIKNYNDEEFVKYQEEDKNLWIKPKYTGNNKVIVYLKSKNGNYGLGTSTYIFSFKATTTKSPEIVYSSHVQDIGWQQEVKNGESTGIINGNKKIEAIKINLKKLPQNSYITYKTHVQDIGWQEWVEEGKEAGTTGENKKVEAIVIESEIEGHVVEYRSYVDGKWQEWVSQGYISGTTGQNKKVEAIQIRIVEEKNKIKIPTPILKSSAHVQDTGWQEWVQSNTTCGLIGAGKKVEAIKIELNDIPYSADFKYKTHVQDIGWENWVTKGEQSGTTGQNKKVEAIVIDASIKGYVIEYRTYVDGKWQDWVPQGYISGTTGQNKKVEAIQIRIVEEKDKIVNPTPIIEYKVHLQDIGWQDWVKDGTVAGLENQDKKIEAIQIRLQNVPYDSLVAYSTHVQDIGWMDWVENGEQSGTTGQNKKIEAIKVDLYGSLEGYSLKYSSCVKDKGGWLSEVSDGTISGTTGKNYKMQALKINLVKN